MSGELTRAIDGTAYNVGNAVKIAFDEGGLKAVIDYAIILAKSNFKLEEDVRTVQYNALIVLQELERLEAAQEWIPVSEGMPDVGRLIHTFESFGDLNATDNIHLLDLDAGGIYRTRIFNNDYRGDSLGCGESLWMYARPLPTDPESPE